MDAVVLANYANEHAPFAIKCLNKGLHVFSEVLPVQTMKEAVESLLAVYEAKSATDTDNKYIFNGHEVTFTLDYRVFDIAGNASMYVLNSFFSPRYCRISFTIGWRF